MERISTTARKLKTQALSESSPVSVLRAFLAPGFWLDAFTATSSSGAVVSASGAMAERFFDFLTAKSASLRVSKVGFVSGCVVLSYMTHRAHSSAASHLRDDSSN